MSRLLLVPFAVALLTVVAACTTYRLPSDEPVEGLPEVIKGFGLRGDLKTSAAFTETKPAVSEHAGPVKVTLKAWCWYSGDGPPPVGMNDPQHERKPGELYTIFYASGEQDLEKVEIREAVTRNATPFDPGAPPLYNETFIVYPGDKDLSLRLKIYDQDRIGDQQADEIRKFLNSAGAKSANLYPQAKETLIPVLQELAALLFIDLPNLFLQNDPLGERGFQVHRSDGRISVDFELETANYCTFAFYGREL